MEEPELKHLLSLTLGWDADLTQQVLGQVKQHALEDSMQGVDDIVQNYMTDSTKCQEAVMMFAQKHRSSILGSDLQVLKRNASLSNDAFNPTPAGKRAQAGNAARPSYSSSVNNQPSSSQSNSKKSTTKSVGANHSASSKSSAHSTPKPGASAPVAAVRGQSLTVKKGVVNKGAKQQDPAHAALNAFDSRVFNCQYCGKVYDIREDTVLALAVIRNDGACTFCSEPLPQAARAAAVAADAAAKVSGDSKGTAASASNAAPVRSGTGGGSSSNAEDKDVQAAQEEVSKGAARARAFAARLVEYDRTAAQRTAVIDDQGDFFEIESNAWLAPEERENLQKQQVLQERLEQQRKDKITVTIDLLGRQVREVQTDALDSSISFEVADTNQDPSLVPPHTRTSQDSSSTAAREGGVTSATNGSKQVHADVTGSGTLGQFRMRPSVVDEAVAPVFVPGHERAGAKARESTASEHLSSSQAGSERVNGAQLIEGWNDDDVSEKSSRQGGNRRHRGKKLRGQRQGQG